MKKRKIVVAVTGASGAKYAFLLMKELRNYRTLLEEVALLFSENARDIWLVEAGALPVNEEPFKMYGTSDFYAPFASGSSDFDTMIICPCSMGTLGRIASGTSDDLITRCADVMLKERRKLILVPRESPLNLIHLENMKKVTLAGGIICPAMPSFYSDPQNMDELLGTVVSRILNLAGFENNAYSWGKTAL